MFDPAILLGVDQIGGPVELPLAQPAVAKARTGRTHASENERAARALG